MEEFKNVINNIIRPALAQHNGDLKVIGIEEGIVKIELLGACRGCPSADISTKLIIEEKLKENFSWIKSVEIINNVSPKIINIDEESDLEKVSEIIKSLKGEN